MGIHLRFKTKYQWFIRNFSVFKVNKNQFYIFPEFEIFIEVSNVEFPSKTIKQLLSDITIIHVDFMNVDV